MNKFEWVNIVTGKGCFVGTLHILQKMEGLGIIKILKIKYHRTNEHYDSTEDLEFFDEDFELIMKECDEHTLNREGGYDFVYMMISGLYGVEVETKRIEVA